MTLNWNGLEGFCWNFSWVVVAGRGGFGSIRMLELEDVWGLDNLAFIIGFIK